MHCMTLYSVYTEQNFQKFLGEKFFFTVATHGGRVALQDGVDFPESEDVLFRQQSSLTPRSIQHRTGMALEGGRIHFTSLFIVCLSNESYL